MLLKIVSHRIVNLQVEALDTGVGDGVGFGAGGTVGLSVTSKGGIDSGAAGGVVFMADVFVAVWVAAKVSVGCKGTAAVGVGSGVSTTAVIVGVRVGPGNSALGLGAGCMMNPAANAPATQSAAMIIFALPVLRKARSFCIYSS